MTNNALAYTAGYIDGDGCFYIGKMSRKYRGRIIISSVDREIVDFFAQKFGGTSRLSCDRKNHPGQKPQFHFYIGGKKSFEFATKLLPFLVEKREQAILFCEFFKTKDKEEKQILIEKMKVLKHSSALVEKSHLKTLKIERNSIEPTEQDFAYFAGFVDAECCLFISKGSAKNKPNPTYKVMLSCNNTKIPNFHWISQRFGGFFSFIKRNHLSSNQRNQIAWGLSCFSLSSVLPKIFPFLKYKKPVCKELMNFYKTTLPNGGDRQSDSFKESYRRVISEREVIVHKVHLLNRKGT